MIRSLFLKEPALPDRDDLICALSTVPIHVSTSTVCTSQRRGHSPGAPNSLKSLKPRPSRWHGGDLWVSE